MEEKRVWFGSDVEALNLTIDILLNAKSGTYETSTILKMKNPVTTDITFNTASSKEAVLSELKAQFVSLWKDFEIRLIRIIDAKTEDGF